MNNLIGETTFWSALDTMVWIASRSEEVVEKHFSRFDEAASNFKALGVWSPQASWSFEHLRDNEFIPALDDGLAGTAFEGEMRHSAGGYYVQARSLQRIAIPRRAPGSGKWFVTFPTRPIAGSKSAQRTKNFAEGGSDIVPAFDAHESEKTLLLEWRPTKSDASLETLLLLDAQFEKSVVIERWPRLLEDEARRISIQPAQQPCLGFSAIRLPWATHRALIPLQEALEFLAFGSLAQNRVQAGTAQGVALDRLQEIVAITRASDSIFAAVLDGQIKLFGEVARTSTPQMPLELTTIKPLSPIRLATNSRSSVAFDTGRPGSFYLPAEWTNVFVEHTSFVSWFNSTRDEARTKANNAQIQKCVIFLMAEYKAGRLLTGSKMKYQEIAKSYGLGHAQFQSACDQAATTLKVETLFTRGRPRGSGTRLA